MALQFTNITYGMTGKQVRDTFNANIHAFETWANGDNIIDDIVAGLSVSAFHSILNTKYASALNRINTLTGGYTEITTSTPDIATVINDNFEGLKTPVASFLADGIPYYLDIKQDTIPDKGVANILSQQGAWKFGYYTGETILYISADGGLTWPYSKAFAAGPDTIGLAQIYNDGHVIFITNANNKIYISDDFLTTIVEETMMDTDGVTPMTFHNPVNPTYPGNYFCCGQHKTTWLIDGVEVFVWGNYPTWYNNGAAPIKIYAKVNNGSSPKVLYHFGQNPSIDLLDDGTPDGGVGGNLLGDAGNPIICKHFHGSSFNSKDNSIWVATGDEYNTTYFFKFLYDAINDTWSYTIYDMGALTVIFRTVDFTFYNGGDNVIWSSDYNGTIRKVTYANLTSAIGNHITKHDNVNVMGLMGTYGKNMFSVAYGTPTEMLISNDYGETWSAVSQTYLKNLYHATKYLMSIRAVDSNGYTLVNRQSAPAVLYAKETFLIKIKDKPVH